MASLRVHADAVAYTPSRRQYTVYAVWGIFVSMSNAGTVFTFRWMISVFSIIKDVFLIDLCHLIMDGEPEQFSNETNVRFISGTANFLASVRN